MSYVVDASVAIKWFIEEELHEQALSLFDQPDALVAPDLICMEIANVAGKKQKEEKFRTLTQSLWKQQSNLHQCDISFQLVH